MCEYLEELDGLRAAEADSERFDAAGGGHLKGGGKPLQLRSLSRECVLPDRADRYS